ncbi:MAG TPA: hypothetical protein DD670_03110 [Planctomycetaceae bacterium]|nr:hypothetical protein [Planctomycetaceae bacterium]
MRPLLAFSPTMWILCEHGAAIRLIQRTEFLCEIATAKVGSHRSAYRVRISTIRDGSVSK